MPQDKWGRCRGCKMWQIEPEAAVADRTMGLCLAEPLIPLRLRVSGNSGCGLFVHGKVRRGEGSSQAPPELVDAADASADTAANQPV